jgi:hypothetical protein
VESRTAVTIPFDDGVIFVTLLANQCELTPDSISAASAMPAGSAAMLIVFAASKGHYEGVQQPTGRT